MDKKLIKNALISAGNGNETKSVNILFDEKIRLISSSEIIKENAEIIDLQGKLLIPGCIDAHVHFNDPGYTFHEDFLSGTSAAACGGITTVIDMPCTSVPPVTNSENLHKKLKVISAKALIDFALWGGIRKNDFPISGKVIYELWNEGVVGFKIYTISGMKTFEDLNYEEIEMILRKFPKILFAFHAEDKKTIEDAIASLSPQELKLAENYVHSRPAAAEIIAVRKILEIAKRNKIHFVHISTKEAAASILEKKPFSDITFETCPHYLAFTANDFSELKGKLKTAPAVKFEKDKNFLRNLLKTGELDFIASDHAGCDYQKEKDLNDFSKVYSGIPGTELMIPYLFSEFYMKGKVPLATMIKITSENPARRYGLFPLKGSLKIGTDADFTVIDLQKEFRVNEAELHSLGKYSPFHGKIFNCSVDKTIVRGAVVFDASRGIVQKAGFGKWIKAEH